MRPMPIIAIAGVMLTLAMIALGAYLWTPDKSRSYLEERYLSRDDAVVTVLGTSLRIRDTAPTAASSTPVLLLHGFGSSLETWQDWAVMLGIDRRVIRLDLPGSGLSAPDTSGNYTDARTIALLLAIMNDKGIEKADIIGNSIGGRIAWQFAALHPQRVRKLILVSPDGFSSPGFDYGKAPKVPIIMAAMAWTLPKSLLKANLDPSYANKERLTPATVTRYHDLMLAPGSRNALLNRMAQTILVDPATRLPKITAPTLLLWGEKDAMIPIENAQDYLRLVPNALLVGLPEIGHLPFEEAPNVSIIPVRDFLDAS